MPMLFRTSYATKRQRERKRHFLTVCLQREKLRFTIIEVLLLYRNMKEALLRDMCHNMS